MDDIGWAIQELALSGSISLGRCSKSTVYRWAKEMNRRMEAENYDWRVKVAKDLTIVQVSKDEKIK